LRTPGALGSDVGDRRVSVGLFLARHELVGDRCPGNDPDRGALLLNHLSRPNVRR
jgi:hypothetical protein